MVVTLTKQQVAQIVAFAGAILPRKISIPALAHALFEPDGAESIKVTLTDLEQTLAISLTAEKLQGAPARFLFPVAELKTLKADTVTLQPMAEDAVVCTAARGGRSFARTVTVPPVSLVFGTAFHGALSYHAVRRMQGRGCAATAPSVATNLREQPPAATKWVSPAEARRRRGNTGGVDCQRISRPLLCAAAPLRGNPLSDWVGTNGASACRGAMAKAIN